MIRRIAPANPVALPAIARRLEELPAGSRAIAAIEVAGPEHEIALESAADVSVVWAHRSGGAGGAAPDSPLLDAVRGISLPSGDGYVWAAGESCAIRALRRHLCEERGIDKKRIRASSYWRRGEQAVHESFDD